MKQLPKLLVFTLIIFLLVVLGIPQAQAATVSSVGIANYLTVNGKVEDGDIIISTSKGYAVSSRSYDPGVVGIMTSNPAISLKTDPQRKGNVPVVYAGTVQVKVVGTNGGIKRGDFIATSSVGGTGMKATKSGYVLGESLQDVSFTNDKEIKIISVNLNLHFVQLGSPITNSIWQIFALTQIATYEEPLRVFRYVASAVVLVMSFVFGFLIFSRTIKTGIEAIGRNPLAGRMIQLSILFNVVLVIIIVMTGIGISYLFLRI